MIRVPRSTFFLLFTVSGFAGLIYESIWSHYLKLFLGHAAYAQTLVLALFMGGMAIGSWLCSRYSARLEKSAARLRARRSADRRLRARVPPGLRRRHRRRLSTPSCRRSAAETAGDAGSSGRWRAALILPQSILLGMTFPADERRASSAAIRDAPGASLAMLYFTNSLGAAIGVLASGFFMIEALGLPGTIQAAGVINLALAAVGLAARARRASPPCRRAATQSRTGRARLAATSGLLLADRAAHRRRLVHLRDRLDPDAVAGARRLDALVRTDALGLHPRPRLRRLLGAAAHRRASPTRSRFLGVVQVVMGLLALATLPLYGADVRTDARWIMKGAGARPTPATRCSCSPATASRSPSCSRPRSAPA